MASPAQTGRSGPLRGNSRLTLALLLAAGIVLSGFTILMGGAPFDEGLVLQAGRRVADGQLPYRDFLWPYGPAQPYLFAGSFKAFGTSLLWWRILRVACDAAVAVTVYALLRRQVSPWLALLGWAAAIGAMAQPTSASPFPPALLLAILAVGVVTRSSGGPRVVLAGVLIAATAAWRLDFAIYAGLASLVGVAACALPVRQRVVAGVKLFVVAAGLGLLVYLPFAIVDGPADLYEALVGNSVRERDYWTLPMPMPWDGGIRDVIENSIPVLLITGLGVAAVLVAASAIRARRLAPRPAALLTLAGCMLLYLTSRADEFHTTPLLVVLACLLPLLSARLGDGLVVSALALVAIALVGVFALNGLSHRATALLRPPELASIPLDVAGHTEAPPAEARALAGMSRAVQRLVPPDEPIYAVTRRSDLVRFNQPLIYVVAERPNPTDRDFGLQTSDREQRRTIAVLNRHPPRAIVRWTDPISTTREPNLRGRPSGSRRLDRWLSRNYERYRTFGYYEVLRRR